MDADSAILSAARRLMRRSGFQQLSVDAVAAEADVSTGTIYRRWPSKLALAVAAYQQTIGPVEPPDTGGLEGDLQALLPELYRFFTGEHAELLTSLLTTVGNDDAVTAAVRRSTQTRRAGLRRILDRAVERGEISPDVDLELAMDMIIGPLWTRLLVTGERVTRPLIRRILAAAALVLTSDGLGD
jgi:AcrR family transcriptional regulator